MADKRPCRICRTWFKPSRNAGARQRVCTRPECQRERHRRSCAALRDAERDEVQLERVTTRLQNTVVAPPTGVPAKDGLGQLRWDAVRDAVGEELGVLLEVLVKHLGFAMRDAVAGKVVGIVEKSGKVARPPRRDAVPPPGAAP